MSAAAGVDQLSTAGDTFENPTIITSDLSNPGVTPIGDERTRLRLSLVSLTSRDATYQADFLPPAEPSLDMHRTWMKEPVCGSTPNNFQIIQRQDQGFLVAWGCEEFRVTTRVDRKTGKILSAYMDSQYRWKMRFCSDDELEGCVDRPDVTKRRHVYLTLKPRHDSLMSENLRRNPIDGLDYVYLSSRDFQMGCVPHDDDCYDEEKPRHRVSIPSGFWIGRTEVTVGAYEQFCQATLRSMPTEPGSGELPAFNPGWIRERTTRWSRSLGEKRRRSVNGAGAGCRPRPSGRSRPEAEPAV